MNYIEEFCTYKKLKKNQIGSAVGDNLDNHHVPQKDIAKKNIDGYPKDKNSQSAPSILIDERLHKQITAQQNTNKAVRNQMSPRELLADDARMLREIGVPNNKIQEIINMNKQKYGLTKGK